MQWNVNNNLHVRMAYFETLRPAVLIEQTLEPTEIAGFNQFFDDSPGTHARRYGIGIDTRMSEGFYGGLEASLRDIEVPLVDFIADGTVQEEAIREESLPGLFLLDTRTPLGRQRRIPVQSIRIRRSEGFSR